MRGIDIVSTGLSILLSLYGAYFGFISILSFVTRRKKPDREHKATKRFAILIAARNEENIIINLIESLSKQNYPRDMYEIFVIPNNCSDDTEKVSKKSGATIIKCDIETKTKGEVLKYVFGKMHSDERYDSYVIFDADNIVHPNFLKKMNNKMMEGYEVVQGFRDSKNPSDSWIATGFTFFYYIQNLFLYESRIRLNASANINGTGWAVTKNVIDKIGFDVKTITEDMEFTTLCAINNIKIGFSEHAITYDEQTNSFVTSWKQRRRWSNGTMHTFQVYQKELFKNLKETKNLHVLDLIILLPIPLIHFSTAVIGLAAFIIDFNIIQSLITIIISYFTCLFVALFVACYYKKKIKSLLSGIILFPIFMLTWMPINIMCFLNTNTKWEAIKHDRTIAIDDILDVE